MEKKNKTAQHLIPNTERKASGANWAKYKNLISKPKTEKNNKENTSQTRRHSKPPIMHATSRHTVSTQNAMILFEVTRMHNVCIFIIHSSAVYNIYIYIYVFLELLIVLVDCSIQKMKAGNTTIPLRTDRKKF